MKREKERTSPPMRVSVSAVYSPDGTRIAFAGKLPDGPYKVYWVSSEGGELHGLTDAVSSQADVNWSSDGQTIIFGELPDYYAESGKPKAI